MGTSCSKVCNKKTKRYEKKGKKKHKRGGEDEKHHNKRNGRRHPRQPAEGGSDKRKGDGKPSQPVAEESNVNYAINAGGVKDNNKGNDENMKENHYIRPNINDKEKADGNGDKNENKKGRERRRKKHKRRSYSSDSSWSSSSSSSSSSSEEENGKTTRSRQKKRNKDGSVTYVTNKTTIGSSKISFKAAKNINIYHNKTNTGMTQPKPEKPRKLFTKEYTEKSARIEERELFSFVQGQTPSPGQFVDLRGRENVQSAFDYGLLYKCSRWVGQINFPKGHCTCFRVGTKFIMTALHCIREIVKRYDDFIPVGAKSSQQDEFSNLSVLSFGNVTVDFNYEIENQPRLEISKFRFKRIDRKEEIPFLDEETDIIVLELLENPTQAFPPHFTNFGIPKLDKTFHLITHSNGDPKAIDKVTKMVDISDPETMADIKFLKEKSKEYMETNSKDPYTYPCETLPYNTIANRSRLLFHCASGKGASGSPGVQTNPDGKVVVVTMLLHGYPDWYYDNECVSLKAGWPNVYTIEQGVNFASVYSKMKTQNPDLCANIFPAEELTNKLHGVQPTDAE